jgi:8-oxo-dGTP pyrophosphatase MutT (NUDIX family)
MKRNRIRALAICIFYNAGRILVNESFDSSKNQVFYRPLGGGIEFGELAVDAISREIFEELNFNITDLHLLGILENIFTYENVPGHEIVYVFNGRFTDRNPYDAPILTGRENNNEIIKAVWQPIDMFLEQNPIGSTPLYPTGLLELIKGNL